jgi:3-methyl-2-oxobutanoate hydroxymethyltransferase
MGHVGLTPQSVHLMGGYRVQGKCSDEAERIMEDARALEQAGAFLLIVEGVPEAVGRALTQAVDIPTVGIGAGRFCDGQVLVLHDLIGLNSGPLPRFARRYAEVGKSIASAAGRYIEDVRRGTFPSEREVYGMPRPVESKAGTGNR